MTETEYKQIENALPEIEKIIVSRSIFSVSIEFRELILEIAKKYNWTSCSTCNSGLFLTVEKVYNEFLKMKEEKLKNEKAKRKPNNKTDKRKP